MLLQWSKALQPPEFLEATRITLLNDEFIPLAVKYSGIEQGMEVLEVGCGTGYFSRYLSRGTDNVHYTGLDLDPELLAKGGPAAGNNQMTYLSGSAFALPFPDNSFDTVVSHTFFNCVEDPQRAMEEMKRVVKPGGRITSVTSMSLSYETWHRGFYPPQCGWVQEIPIFQSKMSKALEKIQCGPLSLNKGLAGSLMPRFFTVSGLKNVQLCPLPRAFSLSDCGLAVEKKKRYVEYLYIGELKRIENAMELEGFMKQVTREECENYISDLKARRDFWLGHLDDNSIWDWFGASALLVSGIWETRA